MHGRAELFNGRHMSLHITTSYFHSFAAWYYIVSHLLIIHFSNFHFLYFHFIIDLRLIAADGEIAISVAK